jgi:hypothetical protein
MRQGAPWALAVFTLFAGGAASAAGQSAAPSAAAPSAAAEPRVRLLEPGRAPLKALRYRAKAGQTVHMSMSMKMGMAMKLGGQALPSTPVPEMRCGIDLKVTEVTPKGDMKYEFEYSSFEVVADPAAPPAVVNAMRDAVGTVKGLRGHGVTNSRGFTQEARIDVPPGANPQIKQIIESLQQSMKQFSAPLPEEPVGAGARWETTYVLEQRGIRIDQVAKMEVKSIEGERLNFAFTLSQSAPPQRITSPDLPATARMDLVSLASKGEGTSVVDLGGLIAAAASLKMQMAMAMRMQMGEQKPQDIESSMDMTMNLTSR